MGNATRETAIHNYLTDMLALERHIEQALAGQMKDLAHYPDVRTEVERIHSQVEFHIATLEGVVNARGGEGAGGVLKKAVSAVAGIGAAAIDIIRTEGVAKNLRDDYTAFSLASIGYVMLHTTALALGDREIGTLAHRHLNDYAKVTMTLHNIVPPAVIKFLREDGLSVNENVLPEVARNIEGVWKHQDVPHADASSVGTRSGNM